MKIVVTSDLHYNIARSKGPTLAVAEEICGLDADVLMILGDVGGRDPEITAECLRLFAPFPGRKLFVAGNHDLWVPPGEDSWDRLMHELPEMCQSVGFHSLDAEPVIIDRVGFAGSIGWYDYSFRPEHLGIPLRFYEGKIAPGAAARLDGYEHLITETHDVPEESWKLGTRWMDGQNVQLAVDDPGFTDRLADRLESHLADVADLCDHIVVGLHHLPFQEMVPRQEDPRWAFASAFLGSERFGEIVLREPKVRYIFCGHSHREDRLQRGQVECINVGSTYVLKRYKLVDI